MSRVPRAMSSCSYGTAPAAATWPDDRSHALQPEYIRGAARAGDVRGNIVGHGYLTLPRGGAICKEWHGGRSRQARKRASSSPAAG
jgi:hypothetical protein